MKCANCGFDNAVTKDLKVTFEGVGDKPCWRIIYGTIDSFWWGPETAIQACHMMAHNWREWTPDISDKWQLLRHVKLIKT